MMMSSSLGKLFFQLLIFRMFVLTTSSYSPTQDSPKKARAKEPSTPSKVLKSARQLVFDAAVYVPVLVA
jgi:hypothetical protein